MATDLTFLMHMWTGSWVHKWTHTYETNAAIQTGVAFPTQNNKVYLDELRPQVDGAQPVS